MPVVAVKDMAGKKVGDIELSNAVFGVEPNKAVMHMAVVNYLANQRQGTQSTLTRSEVSGGGKKPWRQKGTGHARQGSTRAPQWRHGGIALGPKPRDYYYTINKKERQLALKSALSDKVLTESLIVLASNEANVVKSAANIPGVKVAQVNTINTYDIINADSLVIVKDAVKTIEEVYA